MKKQTVRGWVAAKVVMVAVSCLCGDALAAGGTPSGGWTPAATNTALWCDASDAGTILTNVSGVTSWRDKSGNARHLTASGSPTTGGRNINGVNVLDFNGGSLLANASLGLSVAGDVMVLCVYQFDSAGSTAAALFDFQEAARGRFGTRAAGTAQYTGNLSLESNDQGWPGTTAFTGGPYNGPAIVCTAASTNTSKFYAYVNGTSVITPVNYTGTRYTSFTGLRVMCKLGNTQYINGAMAEFIVSTDTAIASRQKFEGYLAWKWGLQGQLPAGHPYKDVAPMLPLQGTVISIK